MGTFELVIGMLFVGALLALCANRVGVPYPALLALGGAVLALVPGTPDVVLDPQLALALFVAPTLLDSAYDASPRDLRARIQIWLSARVEDLPINVLLQFLGTFAVWIVAEKVGLSAIITVVVFAMTLAPRVAGGISARHRMASYAVWEVAVLVLNVLAFVLIGLQLRSILSRINGAERGGYILAAGAACIAVILVRIACAFCVVLSTLVLQGLTLRPLMKVLGLRDDGSVEREVLIARSETARVALRVLDEHTPRSHAADILSREYELRVRPPDSSAPQDVAGEDDVTLPALHLCTVSTQRQALTDLRARRVIGDHAFHVVEEELDRLELTAHSRVRPRTVSGNG
jgi:monovalent cation/hydrogen antiporter